MKKQLVIGFFALALMVPGVTQAGKWRDRARAIANSSVGQAAKDALKDQAQKAANKVCDKHAGRGVDVCKAVVDAVQ